MHEALKIENWRFEVDREIALAMEQPADEAGDPAWTRCRQLLTEYALRPAKRVRSALLLQAFMKARGRMEVPRELYKFAAGVELLHSFMLVHDDIADHATMRRNAPALHTLIDTDRAVVAGDYLFARAVELMLSCKLTHAAEVTRYYLRVCRETAAGQYLDLQLNKVPLSHVSLFQTMKVAQLKTARYSFTAPMIAGARLAGSDESAVYERMGRLVGLSFQLADDLIGLFGDDAVIGKSGASDYLEGKRTFPVVAAYIRANDEQKARLEQLWNNPDPAHLAEARDLVVKTGGKAATERVIKSSRRILKQHAFPWELL